MKIDKYDPPPPPRCHLEEKQQPLVKVKYLP